MGGGLVQELRKTTSGMMHILEIYIYKYSKHGNISVYRYVLYKCYNYTH